MGGGSRSKRRQRHGERKLLVGEEVEVFSTDEGLNGSWHAGIVLELGDCSRLVEYIHFLADDEKSKLVERISVSEAIEGLLTSSSTEHRGIIRPFLPHYDLLESEIEYGLCVDALVDDGWWEGVVIDHYRGSDRTQVLFPDQGDIDVVVVNQLRITQDWDEASGLWKPRGKWGLLQVLQEIEKQGPLPVSIRQIWYDFRYTVAFQERIGSWPFGSLPIWHEFVSELVQDQLAIVDDHPVAKIDPPNQLVGNPMIVGDITKLVGDLPSLKALDLKLDSADLASGSAQLDGVHCPKPDSAEGHALLENGGKNLICATRFIDYKDNPAENSGAIDELCSSVMTSWKPIKIEAEFSYKTVSICADGLPNGKGPFGRYENIRLKVRKHLAALGWRIESKRDKRLRFRYLSPHGRIYLSLHTACQYLMERHHDKDHECECHLEAKFHPEPTFVENKHSHSMKMTKFEKKQSCAAAGRFVSDKGATSERIHTMEFRPVPEMVDSGNQLCFHMVEASSSKIIKKHQESFGESSRERYLISSASNRKVSAKMDIEPEDIPEAIQDYCNYMNRQILEGVVQNADAQLLRSNAKKHLLFIGWRFRTVSKKTKEELRYDSPDGKTYYSLNAACKAYLEGFPQSTSPNNHNCMKRRKTSISLPISKKLEDFAKEKTKHRRSSLPIVIAGDTYHEDVELMHGGIDKVSTFSSSNIAEIGQLGFGELSSRPLGRANKREKDPSSVLVQLRLPHDKLTRHFAHHPSDLRQSNKRTKSKYFISGSLESTGKFRHRVLRSSKRSRNVISVSGQSIARTVLSSLIDNDVVLPRQKVSYIRKRDGHVLMQGRIMRDGIKCNCCLKVFSLANFEAHAGSTSHRPAANIFLQDGRSLLECQAKLILDSKSKSFPHRRMKYDFSKYPSDIICSVCDDGGILLLCDHCPSAFHLECVGLEVVPEENWFCPCCRCGICGMSDFNPDIKQFTEKTVLYCDQCEREYHVGCLRKSGMLGLKSCPTGDWFCNEKCSKIFFHLRNLLGKCNPTSVSGLSWTLFRSCRGNDADEIENIAEYHSKLRVALDVLHECFVTIIEARTQSDLVADILFNKESDLKRLSFWGFYTIILEKGDELVCVATFRVYGDKVAEMPLIGTRVQYRRQGMCRLLVAELEKLLTELGVESLFLPAVPQLLETWTGSFGFTKMANSDRLQLLDYTLLNFQDTTMCCKFLSKAGRVLEEPRGEEKQLACVTNASVEQMDSCNGDIASEEIEVVGPIESLPPLSVNDALPPPAEIVSAGSSANSCALVLQKLVHHDIEGVTVANCTDSHIFGEAPVTAEGVSNNTANSRTNLTDRFSENSNNQGKNAGIGGEFLANIIEDSAVNRYKYYYKRRILAS